MKKTIILNVLSAIVVPIILFLVIEIILYIIGIETIYESQDPYLGYEEIAPLFKKQDKIHSDSLPKFVTQKNKLEWFNYQEFRVDKPKNGFRVFCFGGSTTAGRPYNSTTAFPNWLRLSLQKIVPTKYCEVINVGGISYASYRIIILIEEMLKYQPDLFVVYTGHNEFLEDRTYGTLKNRNPFIIKLDVNLNKLRFYSLLKRGWQKLQNKQIKKAQEKYRMTGEVKTILDYSFGPDRYHRDSDKENVILEHFRYNIERMTAISKRYNVPLIFIVPASNEKDFSPFKSEHNVTMAYDLKEKWEETYNNGRKFFEDGNYEDALLSFKHAMMIDSGYADLHYRLGQTYYNILKFHEAKTAFLSAIENDIVPLRAKREILNTIREVTSSTGTSILDLTNILENINREKFNHSILGNEYFLDHVHLKIEVHQLISEELIKLIIDLNLVQTSTNLDLVDYGEVYESVLATIDSTYYQKRDLNLAKVLDWAGKTDEANNLVMGAVNFLKNDPEAKYAVGLMYQRQGNFDQAIYAYQQVLALDSTFADAYNNLGYIYGKTNNLDLALENLYLAITYRPEFDQPYFNLGDVYYKQGRITESINALLKTIELNPYHIQALNDLGANYIEIGKLGDAITSYEKLIKIAPNYFKAYNNLGIIYYRQKNYAKAREMFQEALRINPNNKFSIHWIETIDSQ
jgi:tetratricopeptide (TPR) repeat protein